MTTEEARRCFSDPSRITEEEHTFDELAKGLAGNMLTRGKALKLFGVALLGFGSLGMWESVAGAKTTGHKQRDSQDSQVASQDSLQAQANEGKIVNGRPAAPGEYPAQGYLQFRVPDGSFVCGGTLVSSRHFLTAGHCVTNPDTGVIGKPQDFSVALGEVNLNNIGPEDLYSVIQVDRHESYRELDGIDYDVAMLTLNKTANFTPTRVVQASERSLWAVVGLLARIIGWGTTSSGGNTSDILLKADVPIRGDNICAAAYPDFTPRMLCAGNGSADTCQGDSGGPLLVPDSTTSALGDFALAGIVSFGNGCSDPAFPGVYARIGDEPLNSWVHTRINTTPPSPSPGTPPPITGPVLPFPGLARAGKRRRKKHHRRH
jgi:secreted trypsin-like serine protease